ncbi:polyphosphate polymerase domain-containing protein [Jeotgalibacillus salarius]|uniref:Polyphosphate polymerase domain-containing protein n=1 Tax=Jeotgalibacillus salarius TaxID=546023 RepID=A0A4Y8LM02_9BACL|nr:polyphosphate polymerase domain-containing protein [Jeotgalibacillus salarius]TFE03976.1 polyphosphate polymerase domain-containing protein [Jeotgalibacillus salarius]
MAIEIFKRYEIKYLLSFDEYLRFREAILPYMKFDDYGNNEGKYNIVSLYFDSEDYKIYYETRNKLRFRQKLRLRVYGDADLNSQSFFEIKQKFKNVVNKRRTILPLNEAYSLIQNPSLDLQQIHASNPQILKEALHFQSIYQLKPEVIVSYDRQALSGIEQKDLRVTFDYNLMCRNHDLKIENGPQGIHFIDKDKVVLEVKVSDSVPFWLSRLLSDFECSRQSVSKFCTSIDLTTQQHLQKMIH